MPVTRAQAKEICTRPEYELVEAGFRPAVSEFTSTRLGSKIERARRARSSQARADARKERRLVKRELGSAAER